MPSSVRGDENESLFLIDFGDLLWRQLVLLSGPFSSTFRAPASATEAGWIDRPLMTTDQTAGTNLVDFSSVGFEEFDVNRPCSLGN